MTDAIRLGDWLKAQRNALELRQSDLAERLGCTDSFIAHIESGKRIPPADFALLLPDALGFDDSQRATFATLLENAQAEHARTQMRQRQERARARAAAFVRATNSEATPDPAGTDPESETDESGDDPELRALLDEIREKYDEMEPGRRRMIASTIRQILSLS